MGKRAKLGERKLKVKVKVKVKVKRKSEGMMRRKKDLGLERIRIDQSEEEIEWGMGRVMRLVDNQWIYELNKVSYFLSLSSLRSRLILSFHQSSHDGSIISIRYTLCCFPNRTPFLDSPPNPLLRIPSRFFLRSHSSSHFTSYSSTRFRSCRNPSR